VCYTSKYVGRFVERGNIMRCPVCHKGDYIKYGKYKAKRNDKVVDLQRYRCQKCLHIWIKE
jgi:transposase-like protein